MISLLTTLSTWNDLHLHVRTTFLENFTIPLRITFKNTHAWYEGTKNTTFKTWLLIYDRLCWSSIWQNDQSSLSSLMTFTSLFINECSANFCDYDLINVKTAYVIFWCVPSSWLLSPSFRRSTCFSSVIWNVYLCYLKCDAIRYTASLCPLSNNCNINTLALKLRIPLCCADLCETVLPSVQ